MGGISTSQSAVLRGGSEQSSSFNVRSWQGLTKVLQAGKESIKDPQAYSEFRDLVLQYAQRGGDPELRAKVESAIRSFGGAVAVPHERERQKPTATEKGSDMEEKPVPAQGHTGPSTIRGIGIQRAVPHFNSETTVQKEEKVLAPRPTSFAAVAADAPHNLPTGEQSHEVPAHMSAEVPSNPPVPTALKSLDEHRARIAEIKRIVHARVGNPVALIDTHNIEGRTYMNMLLGALKATGGNGTEGVDSAMQKLEDAYSALIAHIGEHDETQHRVQEEKPTDTPVTDVQEAPPPAERVIEEVVVKEEQEVPTSIQEDKSAYNEPAPVVSSMQDTEPQSGGRRFSAARTLASLVVEPKEITTPLHPSASAEVTPVEEVIQPSPRPVASDIQPVRKASNVEAPLSQADLSSPQINVALGQLLHEWAIFGGTGFFGLGPSGEENPLYQKLSVLSMGEVLSGRWDGADSKTTKIIKQYADAWRNEQGIAYTAHETFEHYLRRVVQRILKRRGEM